MEEVALSSFVAGMSVELCTEEETESTCPCLRRDGKSLLTCTDDRGRSFSFLYASLCTGVSGSIQAYLSQLSSREGPHTCTDSHLG